MNSLVPNFYFVSHLLRGQKNCTLFLDAVPVSRGQKREIKISALQEFM